MPSWTMSLGFIVTYVGTGLLNLFGNPLILGLFLLGVFAVIAKIMDLPPTSVAVVAITAILVTSLSGLIPEWIGYVTLILVGTLLAFMVGLRGFV